MSTWSFSYDITFSQFSPGSIFIILVYLELCKAFSLCPIENRI